MTPSGQDAPFMQVPKPPLRCSFQLTATAVLRLSPLLQRPWMMSGTWLSRLRASILLHLPRAAL
jgi:hypothetical protein